ncbi:GNAT family N-acetyltransferase [Kurthia massiliensis]|uniref:GNAT family N-acetyltransferase n=1 Tax=Kurthia massiliensis TaxID=1033739 RepID=UPI0002895623|nr:GNAT family N-acetyltransferase [Kurthia massiliensis]
MEFSQEEGRFFIEDNGNTLAEITFTQPNDEFFIIDHTFVDDQLRGQGIANQLVKKVVDKARADDKTIIPLCPFAKGQFERIPEYEDVWRK